MVFSDFTGLVMQLQVVNRRKVWLIYGNLWNIDFVTSSTMAPWWIPMNQGSISWGPGLLMAVTARFYLIQDNDFEKCMVSMIQYWFISKENKRLIQVCFAIETLLHDSIYNVYLFCFCLGGVAVVEKFCVVRCSMHDWLWVCVVTRINFI